MHNVHLVQSYIPAAEKAVREILVENGKVKKIYKSYMAAFGPTIVQMGLLPCIAFYLGNSQGEGDRRVIVHLIAKVVGSKDGHELYKQLASSYENDMSSFYRTKQQVEAAAVALKLAMRTYPDEESNESREEENNGRVQAS